MALKDLLCSLFCFRFIYNFTLYNTKQSEYTIHTERRETDTIGGCYIEFENQER